MNQRNYQKELDEILDRQKEGEKKSLFLHCCCAPCSSYVLEYLHSHFNITIFFYNPNITDDEEYKKRKKELKRFLREVPFGSDISIADADYCKDLFIEKTRGHERDPERGARCEICFRLRLEETARQAAKLGFDYFCTTLSISPHKDAGLLMRLGEELAAQYGIDYLSSDFKKKNGYKRSIELSGEYNLYRQDYCGCQYSREAKEREERQ